MVIGERQIAHLADSNRVDALLRHNHRTLLNSSGAQDASLRRGEDRGIQQCTLGTNVGHREGCAGQVRRTQLLVACALSQIRDALSDVSQGHILNTLQHRNQQTLRGIHSDADVHRVVVGDLLGLRVVGRVDVRVLHQCLSRGLHKEVQVRDVHAMLIDECRLHTLPQLRHASDVCLLDVGELCSGLQGLHHLGSRDLTDAVDLLRGANELSLRSIHGLGGPACAWARVLLFNSAGSSSAAFSSGDDVLLTDATTNTGALNGAQVNAVLVSELAHQRSDVRHLAGVVHLGGTSRCSCRLLGLRSLSLRLVFLLRCFCLWFFCLRLRLGRCIVLLGRCCVGVADAGDDSTNFDGVVFFGENFHDGAGDRGWDFGVDLVCGDLEQWFVDVDGVADGLQPGGDGAFGDGFAEFRHFHIGSVTRTSRRGFLGRLFCLWFFCLRLRLGRCIVLLGRCCVGVADAGDDSTNFDGVVFFGENFHDGAGDRGWDFGVDLVCGDLEQWFVDVDGVADGLQPGGDGAFGDGFAEFRHFHIGSVTRTSRRGFLGRLVGLSRVTGVIGRRLFIRVPNDGDHGTDLNRVVLFCLNFKQNTRYGGRNFRVDLVCGDLEQRFVDLDRITNGLQPRGDSAFGDRFAQLGHLN